LAGNTSIRPLAPRRSGRLSGRAPAPPAGIWAGAAAVAAGVLLLLFGRGGGSGGGETPPGRRQVRAIPTAEATKRSPDAAVSDRRWNEAKERAERAVSLLAEAEAARSSGDSGTFQAKLRQAGEFLEPACEAAARLQEELEAAGHGETPLAREIERSLETWNRKLLVIHKTRAARR